MAAACLVWLSGCETSTKLTSFLGGQRDDPATTASIENPADPADPADPATTGSVAMPTVNPTPDPIVNAANPRMLGKSPTTTSVSARSISAPPISGSPRSISVAPSSCIRATSKPGSASLLPTTG